MSTLYVAWNFGPGGNPAVTRYAAARGLPRCAWAWDGLLNDAAGGNGADPPAEPAVRAAARLAARNGCPLWFDLENPSVSTDPHMTPANMAAWAAVARWTWAEAPGLRWGVYALPDPSVPPAEVTADLRAAYAVLTDAVA